MSYKVAIRRNKSGEVRIVEMGTDWHEASEFWWTEGNMGCDCNRHDVFQGAVDDEPDDFYPCGHTEYTALYAEMPDGTRIKLDSE
jgi:hypothetical protein